MYVDETLYKTVMVYYLSNVASLLTLVVTTIRLVYTIGFLCNGNCFHRILEFFIFINNNINVIVIQFMLL